MGNTSGQVYGGGFRLGYVFGLNLNGRIAGNSASTPYQGLPLLGAKTFALTEPKMRTLNHMGSDRVQAADFLPPTSVAEATITVSAQDQAMQAIVTATKQFAIGEMSTLGHLTSQQGYEPVVAILVCQQAEDAVSRLRYWHSYVIARAKLIPHSPQFLDKEADGNYDAVLIPSSVNIFGAAFTVINNGFTDAQYDDWDSQGLPGIAAWIGDGTTVDFTFPTTQSPALSTAKIAVYKNGTLLSSGITPTLTKVTFTTAPLVTDDITIKWEY
jgi:hypothetical protein